jgi:hypothetical protein
MIYRVQLLHNGKWIDAGTGAGESRSFEYISGFVEALKIQISRGSIRVVDENGNDYSSLFGIAPVDPPELQKQRFVWKFPL